MEVNRRILIVDDNESVHNDFRKILCPAKKDENDVMFDELETALFYEGVERKPTISIDYELDFASQGREGFGKVLAADEAGEPFSLIITDVRMPPGIDGILLIKEVWKVLPQTQVVIASAFSDYTWEDIVGVLGLSDHLMILRKPWDAITIKQLALALTKKWTVEAQLKKYRNHLRGIVSNMKNNPESDGHEMPKF